MSGSGQGNGDALVEIARALRERLLIEQDMLTPGIPQVVMRPAPPEKATRQPLVTASLDATGPAQTPPAPGPSTAERRPRLAQLSQAAAACRACGLHEKRTQTVFARGNPDAPLLFLGEGPGRDEDQQGLPFVGAAGQLLDRMIAAMGFEQEEVYICNVVKCRPPDNRTPRPEEALACSQYLHPQIDAVAPQVIVGLGRCAADSLGLSPERGPFRGRWGTFRGVPAFATYHPAYLLRTPEAKKIVWADLQEVMARLGREPPPRKR